MSSPIAPHTPSPRADLTLADFDYPLPDAAIAKRPLDARSESRLLELPVDGPVRHKRFLDVIDLVGPGDVLVLNDTRVVPARLQAQKAGTGGRVEVLLTRPTADGAWLCLVNANKKPKPNMAITLGDPAGDAPVLHAVIEQPLDDEPGAYRVRFNGDVLAHAATHGSMPLPPYMNRAADDADDARYQTVFSDPDKLGSSAAPTAGLHFTPAVLDALRDKGVHIAHVTLHVGPGTFLPVRTERIHEHRMHAERWVMPGASADALNAARAAGGRIISVGTTALRVLESAATGPDDAPFVAGAGLTRLFLTPGSRVRSIDAILTNFHQPKSTLVMLVSALCGRDRVLAAYQTALDEGYRFLSYGDATFLHVKPDAMTPDHPGRTRAVRRTP